MSETPPPYAQYPRNVEPAYGSAAQLKALSEAYYGYSNLFVLNIVLSFGLRALGSVANNGVLIVLAIVALVVVVLFGCLTYPLNKKIGFGANWSSGQVIAATVLMAFNSLCCGIIGYAVMQTIVSNHIKRYGVKSGCLGMKKPAIQERIAELQAAEGNPYTP